MTDRLATKGRESWLLETTAELTQLPFRKPSRSRQVLELVFMTMILTSMMNRKSKEMSSRLLMMTISIPCFPNPNLKNRMIESLDQSVAGDEGEGVEANGFQLTRPAETIGPRVRKKTQVKLFLAIPKSHLGKMLSALWSQAIWKIISAIQATVMDVVRAGVVLEEIANESILAPFLGARSDTRGMTPNILFFDLFSSQHQCEYRWSKRNGSLSF